jgi:hypothetical protein
MVSSVWYGNHQGYRLPLLLHNFDTVGEFIRRANR